MLDHRDVVRDALGAHGLEGLAVEMPRKPAASRGRARRRASGDAATISSGVTSGRMRRRLQRHHAREVADAVHRVRAQAEHEAEQAVLARMRAIPAVVVARERHARHGGEEVAAVPRPDDRLDHDGHALVVIDQVVPAAVGDRVRAEHAGVDLGDGGQQARAAAPRASPWFGEEQALVDAGERRAEAVLEQAGGAHDQRHLAPAGQLGAEAVGDARRELRVAEDGRMAR